MEKVYSVLRVSVDSVICNISLFVCILMKVVPYFKDRLNYAPPNFCSKTLEIIRVMRKVSRQPSYT